MKKLVIPPEFEAEILKRAATRLRTIAKALEYRGDTIQAFTLRHRAEELEENANRRIN